MTRMTTVTAALSRLSAVLLSSVLAAQVPSTKEFLGHDIGEDFFLADYTQLRSYWTELAKRSDRMLLQEFGTTSYGQPMVHAVISSPENLKRLGEIQALNRRLALGRDEDRRIARELATRSRSIIWIDSGMHATESVAAQNIIELAYRMTSGETEEIQRILDEVVLVVVPANPDGLEMVAKSYMATKQVGRLPVLYQKYIGHDNNRDYYAANQRETRNLCRAIYHTWLPQVLYNHHQSAPRGTIIFTPPFRDPYNYNFDPIVVNGMNTVAAHMNRRFASERKPGVISRSGAPYSAWWNGGLRTMVPFHNMIGILTESFGSPNPQDLEPKIDRRVPYGDYPDPIGPQKWHARQTIEYLQTANFAILDYASRYRNDLILDQWQMARNSIERGSRDHWTTTPKLAEIAKERDARARVVEASNEGGNEGAEGSDNEGESSEIDPWADPDLRDPRVYVLPSDQHNFTAATRLIRSLRFAAIEVHRAKSPVKVGKRDYAAGSYFLFMDQAFRPHLRDMFEPQWHPDLVGSGGDPVRPYDAAGWTLALQHDIDFDRLLEDEVPRDDLELVEDLEVAFHPRTIAGEGDAGYVMPHNEVNGYHATNELLQKGEQVFWVSGSSGGSAGQVFVRAKSGTHDVVRTLAAKLGVPFERVGSEPAGDKLALTSPRIGLFDVYGGNMATGWMQWLLLEFGFDVELVFAPRVDAGNLAKDYDVLIFCTGLPTAGRRDQLDRALRRGRSAIKKETVDKVVAALPPFEDWSSVVDRHKKLEVAKTMPALQEFVTGGGVLITLGSQATRIAKHFDLPVDEGVWITEKGEQRRARNSEFFVPGSLLWIDINQDTPIAWGCSPRLATMFRRSPVFAVRRTATDEPRVESLAHYIEDDMLASGWGKGTEHLVGKSAAIRAEMGKGQVYLFGSDVTYRGQPLGTFKLLFNAIFAGTAR